MKMRFGPDCLKAAIILGVNAFLMAIMITFVVPAINRYRYTDDDKKKEEEDEKKIEMTKV